MVSRVFLKIVVYDTVIYTKPNLKSQKITDWDLFLLKIFEHIPKHRLREKVQIVF